MATGVDQNRVQLLMAVLEKRMGMLLQAQDAYIKVAGGVKLDEPAIDFAVLTSIVSSFRNQPVQVTDVYIGEVGLTGEVDGYPASNKEFMKLQDLDLNGPLSLLLI